jgi:hypothetical protein
MVYSIKVLEQFSITITILVLDPRSNSMRKTVLAVAVFAVSFMLVLAVSVRADDQSDPRAIIDRAIQAAGGEAALTKNKAHTWNETGTFYGFGDGVPFKGAYAAQFPEKFKMAIENFITVIVVGDKGWNNGAEMDAQQLAEWKEFSYAGGVSSLLPLKDKGFTLTVVGESKVGDQAAVGVKVAHEGHRDITLYFDRKTGLLAKAATRVKQEDGKEVAQETEQRDYKDMNGIKVPTKIVVQRDGKRFIEAEVADWKGTDKLDNSIFKP